MTPPRPSRADPVDWRAVAENLVDALETLNEGWLYLTASESPDCLPAIKDDAPARLRAGVEKRRAAVAAYRAAVAASVA